MNWLISFFRNLFTKQPVSVPAPVPQVPKQSAAPGDSSAGAVPSSTPKQGQSPGTTESPISKPANIESTCPAPGVFGAVDLCTYSTQHFLDVMRYLGVKTIVRYYEHVNETLHGKTPTAAEIALIKKNGFKMLAVFQHSNNSVVTFETPGRGTKDALRSLELAKLWGQPKGSAIYFGVDFDPSLGNEMNAVLYYAKCFSQEVRAQGYRVGTYGSGLTLETLLDAKLIDLAWLSMSTGFQHSKAFEASKRWNLHQVKDRTCGGINVDFNYTHGDIGDWWPQ